MASPLSRLAASMARSHHSIRSLRQQLCGASVHTVPDSQLGTAEQPEQINQDTYAREEHKWDDSDLEGGPRAARFPSTLYVPEGAARVSMPDFPSIIRHSLSEPAYGSFGSSLRDPAYTYIPKRRMSTYTIITGSMPAKAATPDVQYDKHTYQSGYQPESHRWSSEMPLPSVGTWYKADE